MKPIKQILATSLCLTALAAPAQPTVDWFKVAGGGGINTNGQYSLSATIGQSDAVPATLQARFYRLVTP